MGRRRKLIKLPFLKFKINKQTIFNVVGFFLFSTGIVLLLSYFSFFFSENDGRLLSKINQMVGSKFGGLKIIIPLLVILFSAHFFNTKKLKFIRPNVTVGAVMIFIAVLGIFQSGEYGQLLFSNLLFCPWFGRIVYFFQKC